MQFRDSIIINQEEERKVRYVRKMPKMHFEEKIMAKCVLYIFSYKNILLKYTKTVKCSQERVI